MATAMHYVPFILPLAAFMLFVIWRLLAPSLQRDQAKSSTGEDKEVDPYHSLEPLQDFDWSSTEPIKIRPFKPKYHLTMALETCPLSELVAIDKTYLDRMKIRTEIMDHYPLETYQCYKACEQAVFEMYEWTFGTYLPQRFPTMYKLVSKGEKEGSRPMLQNIPADEYIPLQPSSPTDALYTLGRHVDTDILFLLPLSTAADGSPIYHLQAYVCCFPSGFKTHEKIGLPLASIHKPVPGYKAKLEKSMDRFFAKMDLGRAVRRVNWSITTNDLLYSQGGNHLYDGGKTTSGADAEAVSAKPKAENQKTLDIEADGLEESIEEQKKDVVVDDCRLRCERQTLHRLPKTNALVFMFKTYLYTIEEVKAEGEGPALADAIPGLAQGSVPDMAYYKRQVVWGDKVVEYLRR